MYRLKRWLRGSFAALLLVLLFLAATYFGPRDGQALTFPGAGAIRVSDGDSFARDGVRYRLDAIDAPELDQSCTRADGSDWPCGREARAHLEKLVSTAELRCTGRGADRYGRTLANCRAGQIADIGKEMVRAGLAVSYSREKIGPYVVEEMKARLAGRGIWQGDFERPEDWRRAHAPE